MVTLKRLPYPGTPLTVGSSGDTVLYYNLLLQRIAYYFSSVEAPPLADRYTDETAAATRSAQQLLGLEQTGIADADTWTAVEALSLQLAAHAPNPDRDTPPGTAYPGRAIAEGSAGQEVGRWSAGSTAGHSFPAARTMWPPPPCGLSSSRRGCTR